MSDNDSRARRRAGPRRRARHAALGWPKREPWPSPARRIQIHRFCNSMDSGDWPAAKQLLANEPIED